MNILLGQVPWFPQDYATEFFIAKGVLALLATCMVITHMARTWASVTRWGQRLRYLSLLALIANMAFASVEQVQTVTSVEFRHIGALCGALMVVAAMAVSIHEDILRGRIKR